MRIVLSWVLALMPLVLSGCSDGESSRSSTPGQAPFNPKSDENADKDTKEESKSTGTEKGTDTATGTEAGTDTETSTGFTCEGEVDTTLTVTNPVGFKPTCKELNFTSPGNFRVELLGNESGNKLGTIFFQWDGPDDNSGPTAGTAYTNTTKNPDGSSPSPVYYSPADTGAGMPEVLTESSSVKYVKIPTAPGTTYQIDYEFVQAYGSKPTEKMTFKGSFDGKVPSL